MWKSWLAGTVVVQRRGAPIYRPSRIGMADFNGGGRPDIYQHAECPYGLESICMFGPERGVVVVLDVPTEETRTGKVVLNILANDRVTRHARVTLTTPPRYGTVTLTPELKVRYAPDPTPRSRRSPGSAIRCHPRDLDREHPPYGPPRPILRFTVRTDAARLLVAQDRLDSRSIRDNVRVRRQETALRPILPALGLAGVLLAVTVAVPTSQAAARDDHWSGPSATSRPLVIAHRGASGYRPEHTLEAYRLAIRMGVDFIEPDLVSTEDGVLVARHENEISGTTDVSAHPEFAARRTTKTIDGVAVTGWFTEDFTLAELKTLRAKERLPQVRPTNTAFDGKLPVPTLQEVIDLAASESRRLGRTIGIYPETKHPTYFQSIGLPLEEPLVQMLKRNKLTSMKDPVIIQSFETANLRKLNKLTNVRLAQLLDAAGRPYDFTVAGDPRGYVDLVEPENLRWISTYADGIGANKNLLIPRDPTGKLLAPTAVVRDAHRIGLVVHAWTFRAENQFLPTDFRLGADPNARGDITAEYELFFLLGLDGVFSDHPDTAVAVRAAVG